MEKSKASGSKTQINTQAILAVLVFSAFIALINETILNVALNTLMEEMKVTAGIIQWIVTGYMIVISVMVPVTAFLVETFEIKKLYLAAMAILLAGTMGGACSASFAMLLISRMVQAAGTGMLIPIMMNTVLVITSPEKRGTAMGMCVCAIQIGPALGPTVSGLLLQFFNWHVLFLVLIPFILIGMIMGTVCLVHVTTLTKPKIDIPSIILSTAGVGGVIYGLSSISGGDMRITAAVSLTGVLSLAVFGKRQLSLKEPMLELRTCKYPIFSISTALVMISMMTVFTMNVMLPLYLQGALLTTTFLSALILLPATLTNGLITLAGGKIYDKIGAKILLPAGFAVMFAAILAISRSTSSTSAALIVFVYMAVCLGVGCTMSPAQTHALNQLPKEAYPHGVAIINTLQQIAAAIGSSLFLSIMSASEQKALRQSKPGPEAAAAGFRTSASVLAAVIFVGLCLSFALRPGKRKSEREAPDAGQNQA